MLPDSYRSPPSVKQNRIGFRVTFTVALDLGTPPGCIGFGEGLVLRAAVPEAAVDEHGNASAREHEIGAPAPAGKRPEIDAVTKARSMEMRSNLQFAGRVSAALTLHPSSDLG